MCVSPMNVWGFPCKLKYMYIFDEVEQANSYLHHSMSYLFMCYLSSKQIACSGHTGGQFSTVSVDLSLFNIAFAGLRLSIWYYDVVFCS